MLRAYGKCSGDRSVQERVDVQTGIKMILKLCLADGFDMFPTLLVTDGSCMIDRRMGIHGHPLEIQVLLFSIIISPTGESIYFCIKKKKHDFSFVQFQFVSEVEVASSLNGNRTT